MQLPQNLASESRATRDGRAAGKINLVLLLGILFALAIGAALRFPQLDARPMHNDEGVNAIKLDALWKTGEYRFDPNEFHGPTLPYASWLWLKLAGPAHYVDFTESELRMLTVLFGLGIICLIPLVADGLGKWPAICAAILTAISPAMVFYSRYYIHEMLLVFFTFLTLAAGWRYYRTGRIGWALLTGAAIGLMQSTKETFVFAVAAMVGALIAEKFFERGEPVEGKPAQSTFRWNWKHIAAGVAVWIVIAIILFTSFFTNWRGPLDAVRTYMPWLNRAAGHSEHIHPWYFYLQRLAWFHMRRGPVWSEGLILFLAGVGCLAAFARKQFAAGDKQFIRFVAFYTIFLTLIYTGISYKTPWCLLSFWTGMILLAGVGTVALVQVLRIRWLQMIAIFVLIDACGQLSMQAWRADVDYAADSRNPYVYAQTAPDALNLVALVERLGKAGPQKDETVIYVMAPESDYWPLPWYLRNFAHVGWFAKMPSTQDAPIMIVSTQFSAALEKNTKYISAGLFELRPGAWFELYVDGKLWDTYLKTRAAAG